MSKRNITIAHQMYSEGSSIGRIASALNCSVMAVAYQLTQGCAL